MEVRGRRALSCAAGVRPVRVVGVDAGAAADIHRAIRSLAEAGSAILIISQDLDEILALCDRVAVVSQGTLSTVHPIQEVTPEQIGMLMGIRHDAIENEATRVTA